jgi:hypothetical protein
VPVSAGPLVLGGEGPLAAAAAALAKDGPPGSAFLAVKVRGWRD